MTPTPASHLLRFIVLLGSCFTLAGLARESSGAVVVKEELPLISETFDGPLAADRWKALPNNAVTAGKGTLTINARGPENAYAVSMVHWATPSDKLNFMQNTVAIKVRDLAIKGSGAPGHRVFMVILGSDRSDDNAKSRALLRITADGGLIVFVGDKGAATFLSYYGSATLPIKTLELTLHPSGARLSLEDAKGPSEKEFRFTSAPISWTNCMPFLRLQSQRDPGAGDAQVTLRGFTVESIPATEAR